MKNPRLPKTPYPLLLIEWADSRQPHAGWLRMSDVPKAKEIRCISVGYLISETKAAILLAPTIADLDENDPQTSGFMDIPKRAIVRRVVLA